LSRDLRTARKEQPEDGGCEPDLEPSAPRSPDHRRVQAPPPEMKPGGFTGGGWAGEDLLPHLRDDTGACGTRTCPHVSGATAEKAASCGLFRCRLGDVGTDPPHLPVTTADHAARGLSPLSGTITSPMRALTRGNWPQLQV